MMLLRRKIDLPINMNIHAGAASLEVTCQRPNSCGISVSHDQGRNTDLHSRIPSQTEQITGKCQPDFTVISNTLKTG